MEKVQQTEERMAKLEQAEQERIELQQRLEAMRTGPCKRTAARRSVVAEDTAIPSPTASTSQEPDREYMNEHPQKRKGIKPPKICELPVYAARSLQDAQAFIAGAERQFRVDNRYHYPDDTAKIDACVLAFDKGPAAKWESYERRVGIQNVTWDQFKEWIMDGIQDKANRAFSAASQYERAWQRIGQSADDFASYLDSLELELGITDDEVQKNLLYGKLQGRPETADQPL